MIIDKNAFGFKLKESIIDLIRRRTSYRTYNDQALSYDMQKKLVNFFTTSTIGPFGNTARFQLIATDGLDNTELNGLGTYGFIKGAKSFIAGIVEEKKDNGRHLIDFGFLMQRIILYATDLELGTCWIGGTFTKSSFAKKVDLQGNELLPGISPIGVPATRRGTIENIIRWSAKAKIRLPWENLFFLNFPGNPIKAEHIGKYAEALEMVRIGPSASNKQPWRVIFESEKNIFHFFLQRTKGYIKSNQRLGSADLQLIDMGIALAHFAFTCAELGFTGEYYLAALTIPGLPDDYEYIISYRKE